MRLAKFDGGLNLTKAPHLIAPYEAVVSENVDYESGTLKALKSDTNFIAGIPDDTVSAYYWFAKDDAYSQKWIYQDAETEWVEYQEKLYWTKAGLGLFTYNSLDEEVSLTLTTPVADITPIFVEQQLNPKEVMTAEVPTYDPNAPESEPVYLPFMDVTGGDWPSTSPGNGRDYAFVNITDSDKAVSSPQYFTFYKGVGLAATGYNIETRIYGNIAEPTTPLDTPLMELSIYRKYNGKYIYITSLFNADDTTSTQFLDNVYAGPGVTIELTPEYSLTGLYTYAIAEYDPDTGAESDLRVMQEYNLVNTQLWWPRNAVPVDKTYRLYRVGGDLTTFTLVGEIEYSADPNDYFKDIYRDIDLIEGFYDSRTKGAPPLSLRYITELNAMFFGADNDKLRFTPIGQPAAWPSEFFLDFPARITGIGKSSVGLLVFTLFETWLITGTSPSTLAQVRISGSQGCAKHHSICYTKNACLWFSLEGLCSSSGTNVILQTRNRLGKLDYDIVNAVLLDEKYYALLVDGSIFKADFVFSSFAFVKQPSADLPYLYRWLVIAPQSASNPVHSLHALRSEGETKTRVSFFTSLNDRTWKYRTGRFIGSGLTLQKAYKKIYLYLRPPVSVTVFTNAGSVAFAEYTEEQPEDIYTLMVDSTRLRGKWIQLEFEGTGEVFEVEIDETSVNG